MGRVANAVVNNKTGQISKVVHHCTECGAPGSNICLKKIHQAYCEECYRLFNVITPGGCTKHPYRDGYNRSVVEARMKKDPGFKMPQESNAEEPVEEVQEEEARPYDTDWSKPAFKPKHEPKAKIKDSQGKKQQPAKSIKDMYDVEAIE